jgi:hypothetical protein
MFIVLIGSEDAKPFKIFDKVDIVGIFFSGGDPDLKTTVTINTAENFYSILRRGIMGIYGRDVTTRDGWYG